MFVTIRQLNQTWYIPMNVVGICQHNIKNVSPGVEMSRLRHVTVVLQSSAMSVISRKGFTVLV